MRNNTQTSSVYSPFLRLEPEAIVLQILSHNAQHKKSNY